MTAWKRKTDLCQAEIDACRVKSNRGAAFCVLSLLGNFRRKGWKDIWRATWTGHRAFCEQTRIDELP